MGDEVPQEGGLDVRVSDAERGDVVGVLRDQTAAGRLTLAEFEDRLGEVYAARTAGELRHALRELPVRAPAEERAEAEVADRAEKKLRQRYRRRMRGELAAFAMPNVVCNAIWLAGDAPRWWPGWVLLGTGVGAVTTLVKGFDPDAERAKLEAEERLQAIEAIELRGRLGR